jgi:hypothetical protein
VTTFYRVMEASPMLSRSLGLRLAITLRQSTALINTVVTLQTKLFGKIRFIRYKDYCIYLT